MNTKSLKRAVSALEQILRDPNVSKADRYAIKKSLKTMKRLRNGNKVEAKEVNEMTFMLSRALVSYYRITLD